MGGLKLSALAQVDLTTPLRGMGAGPGGERRWTGRELMRGTRECQICSALSGSKNFILKCIF